MEYESVTNYGVLGNRSVTLRIGKGNTYQRNTFQKILLILPGSQPRPAAVSSCPVLRSVRIPRAGQIFRPHHYDLRCVTGYPRRRHAKLAHRNAAGGTRGRERTGRPDEGRREAQDCRTTEAALCQGDAPFERTKNGPTVISFRCHPSRFPSSLSPFAPPPPPPGEQTSRRYGSVESKRRDGATFRRGSTSQGTSRPVPTRRIVHLIRCLPTDRGVVVVVGGGASGCGAMEDAHSALSESHASRRATPGPARRGGTAETRPPAPPITPALRSGASAVAATRCERVVTAAIFIETAIGFVRELSQRQMSRTVIRSPRYNAIIHDRLQFAVIRSKSIVFEAF